MSAKPLPQADDNVKIPDAVKRIAAKAEEIHNAAYPKPDKPAEGNEPAKEPAKAEAPAPEAPAEPAPAPVEPAKTTPEVTPKQADPAAVDWEQRYRAMKGRFGQSERVVKELQDKVQSFEALLATMQQPAKPTASPDTVPEIHITEKDRAEFGDDFINLARRAAREEAAPRIAQLEKALTDAQRTIQQLTGQVGKTAETMQLTARQQMFKELNEAVPNWKQLNNDPKFLDWLDLPDTYSGVIRHELLKAAEAASDASRIQAFFKGFLAEEAAKVPQDQAPAPALPQGVTTVEKVPLETFAAPGRAKSAPTPVAAEKPIFTRDQVTKFYVDSARGVYAGREAEKNKLEAQIHQAGLEGRIR